MHIRSTFKAGVRYNNPTTVATFYVSAENRIPLLSYDTASRLGLIKLNIHSNLGS